jgi:hypothetical protein
MKLRRTILSAVMGAALLAPSMPAIPAAANVDAAPPPAVLDAANEAPAPFIEAAPNPQVPSTYESVAETPSLRLYINRDDSKIIVEDKRSSKLWTSNPLEQLGEQKTILDDAVFQLNYTNARRQMTNLASSASEKPALTFTNITNGIRVGYDLQKLKIKLNIEYVIKEEQRVDVTGIAPYLEVTVPSDGLKEEGDCVLATSTTCAKLTSLEVLPMFGAAPVGADGYLVVPDGMGAVVNFKSETAQYRQRYSQQIYGTDAASTNFTGRGGTTGLTTRISLPLFGLKQGASAYSAVVTKGDFQANINAYMAGYITNASRASAEFLYRRQASIPRRRTLFVNRIEDDWMRGDRQVRFYLLNGDDASYSGIAKIYRNYLMKDKGMKRLGKELPRQILTFYHGITRRSSFREDMVPMTTFDNAIEITKGFLDAGVKDLDIQLYGWNDDGDRGRWPRRYPAEEAIGGNDGLRNLTAWAHKNGVRVFLYDNYNTGYVGSSGGIFGQIPLIRNLWPNWSYGFNTRFDTVRGVNKLPVAFGPPGPWQSYLLNPVVARERYVVKDVPKHKSMGADGVTMTYGRFVQSDLNDRYPLGRDQTAAEYGKTIDYIKSQLGEVILSSGGGGSANNAYAFPWANRLLDAPELALDAFGDVPVPIYHIATQGLLTRYSWAPNLRNDQRTEFLHEIEYGLQPEYWLTHQPADDLIRTSNTWLYSTEWKDWLDPAAKEYKQVHDEFGYLNSQFIVKHEMLAEDVNRVTYEDGSTLTLNHTSVPYSGPDGVVPALSYVLRKGGATR